MSFRQALGDTILDEGAYSNDPRDSGGETVYGISRRHHPAWAGWAIVDRLKRQSGDGALLRAAIAVEPSIKPLVENFYLTEFWGPLRCDEMPDSVAHELFNLGINTGHKAAILTLQAALVLAGAGSVEVDGSIGPVTLAAARSYETQVGKLWRAVQVGHYVCVATKLDPSKAVFLTGWVRRAIR